jgi:ERCC4-type nuclease
MKEKTIIKYHHTEDKSGVPNAIFESQLGKPLYRTKLTLELNKANEIDYIISDKVGIERKSMNDLAGSLQEKKIPMQIKRIIDEGLTPIFLVEGIIPDATQSKMEWKSIYGFMSWLSEAGIIVEHTIDYEHSSLRICNIALAVRLGKFQEFKVPVIKINADHPTLQRLMAIPGISEILAVKIREHFHNESDFYNACEFQVEHGDSTFTDIKGIGKVLANNIAREVTKPWGDKDEK